MAKQAKSKFSNLLVGSAGLAYRSGMTVHLERRKAVMARSIKLGHCVCNTRQTCPCDIFKERDLCPCAGEKASPRHGQVALTRVVRKAGCASKIGQAELREILGRLPATEDPRILVGTAAGDDAGVYRLDDQHCLVQTVDVFTPCVDDPFLFGQIAAANSLSDVYAMGGRPLTALSVVGFPTDELDGQIMSDILRGGVEKLCEAGCSLLGGHSWQDEEIKCGFAITGVMESAQVVIRDNAQPGDVLVLTKPLGTGMVCFAAQLGRISAPALSAVGASMATLNRDAAQLMVQFQAHACTDITGFGLLGHLGEMARRSRVQIELDLPALPVHGAAAACLDQEILPGAIDRNQDFAASSLEILCRAFPKNLPILFDPQTSGGLLISLPEPAARMLVRELHDRGHTATAIIGRVIAPENAGKEGRIVVRDSRLANIIGPTDVLLPPEDPPANTAAPLSGTLPIAEPASICCSDAVSMTADATVVPPTGVVSGPVGAKPVAMADDAGDGLDDLFRTFLKRANQGGAIDGRTKKLMAIALSVATRCKPCLAMHLQSAASLGISDAELDEAAWLGIAFAGSPAMVLYQETCRELKAKPGSG